MLNSFLVDVDLGGIVIFDYPGICELFNGKINKGQNILKELTSLSDDGKVDKGALALDKGLALPIIGIDDGSYCVRVFLNELPDNNERKIIFSDKYFYLNVTGELYVTDIISFWEWEEYAGWDKTDIPKGIYKVCLEGVHIIKKHDTFDSKDPRTEYIEDGEILDCYDLILEKVSRIGVRTLEPRSNSRLYKPLC